MPRINSNVQVHIPEDLKTTLDGVKVTKTFETSIPESGVHKVPLRVTFDFTGYSLTEAMEAAVKPVVIGFQGAFRTAADPAAGPTDAASIRDRVLAMWGPDEDGNPTVVMAADAGKSPWKDGSRSSDPVGAYARKIKGGHVPPYSEVVATAQMIGATVPTPEEYVARWGDGAEVDIDMPSDQ